MKFNFCKKPSQNPPAPKNRRLVRNRKREAHEKASRERKIQFFKISDDPRMKGNYSRSISEAEKEAWATFYKYGLPLKILTDSC
ncbi:unnamed protein product [Moneuplotes crassus]|uniref:Uncharacterized protein n=1 Tax=Euplotes crassus TaxID=5936 RepID=A0AAD1X1F1_EUPCR|nr:unnamed protein product [Moneuplotes crassus]